MSGFVHSELDMFLFLTRFLLQERKFFTRKFMVQQILKPVEAG
jgi:hypothetical protein